MVALGDPAVGQHRVHLALAGGGCADQAGPVARAAPVGLGDLLGRDPGLGQQVGAQQLRQGARIDLVVL
jgi:hypothetical protein